MAAGAANYYKRLLWVRRWQGQGVGSGRRANVYGVMRLRGLSIGSRTAQ